MTTADRRLRLLDSSAPPELPANVLHGAINISSLRDYHPDERLEIPLKVFRPYSTPV